MTDSMTDPTIHPTTDPTSDTGTWQATGADPSAREAGSTVDDAGGGAADGAPRRLEERHRRRVDELLVALAGPEARLRPDQEHAVAELARPGARVLVVQATGWGKSAVYWAATALRRLDGAGPTLVVSPLIALMRDQVAAAARAGLRAATLNSGNVGEWSAVEEGLRSGDIDVLLVSPERLANPGFGRRVLDALSGRLGLVVIDEAHAVSDWGHDFRPDYRRVADVLARLDPQTPVLATTATANARVTDDVAAQLGASTLVLRGPLARSSLQLSVVPALTPLQRFAWVAEHLPRLPGSGIVYALTVSDAERLTEALRAVHGDDVPVAAYTGRLPVEEREQLEDALRRNELKALVATSALGMGYDKPDLGFVVHVGAPPSPVSYYQQVGRAGRAIDHAVVALLPSDSDAGVWEHFTTSTLPDPDMAASLLDALGRAGVDPGGQPHPMSVPELEAATSLRRGRLELLLKQLAVDGAVDRVEGGWVATGAPWHYDAEHYAGIVAGRRREADIMRDYIGSRRCLMQLLQEALDDPAAAPCGRCSVCLGRLPEGLSGAVDPAVTALVAGRLRSEAAVFEPRKMWPGGAFGRGGRIPAELMAEPGRVLVHADAPEWHESLAGSLQHDGPAEPELLEGAVSLLVGWRGQWERRPEVCVTLVCAGLPSLTGQIADHVASVGRLNRADFAVAGGAPPAQGEASASVAAAWRDRLEAGPELAEQVRGRSVLLVVDRTRDGWPVTLAAAELRRQGATHVLPLVVHRLP